MSRPCPISFPPRRPHQRRQASFGALCARHTGGGSWRVSCQLRIFSPADVRASSYVRQQSVRQQAGAQQLAWAASLAAAAEQQVEGPGDVTFRLFHGEVVRGPLSGRRVELKAWPRPDFSPLADALAANEVAAHAALLAPAPGGSGQSPRVQRLLGGFVAGEGVSAGEQWLVLEAPVAAGSVQSAEQFALRAAANPAAGAEAQAQRRAFVREAARQALEGLAAMHDRSRLHQGLCPAALTLACSFGEGSSSSDGREGPSSGEGDPSTLAATLRDLHFSVDVGDEAMFGGATLGEIWDRGAVGSESEPLLSLAAGLWRRARAAGAWSVEDRRAFGLADDVASAGWLLAYLAFVPLSVPGSVNGPTLQRLFAATFKLDLAGAREYCEAEEAWAPATALLADRGGAGWALLQAMLAPDWRGRPSAAQCLQHPFFSK